MPRPPRRRSARQHRALSVKAPRARKGTILRVQEERGRKAENAVYRALCALRDEFNVPIKVEKTRPYSGKDRRSVDFDIRGRGVLHVWLVLDVKSSETGVEQFENRQTSRRAGGSSASRVHIAFQHNSESLPALMVRLLRLLLEHSASHAAWAEKVPSYEDLAERDRFEEELQLFCECAFSD